MALILYMPTNLNKDLNPAAESHFVVDMEYKQPTLWWCKWHVICETATHPVSRPELIKMMSHA